jgi:exonuclease SbcC
MIPLHLSISGFLSYRTPAEIDFTSIDLACISGANGAGKSSLLDAITWVLFGIARKRDDALIHSQSQAAEVRLTFAYEGNVYRVIRAKAREKTALLEFHLLQEPLAVDWNVAELNQATWKPLTERALRETELRIQQTLRLDYETFVNASFFLQGKADQFTQQRPADRKRILGSILGLDAWEVYRQRAADQRKALEQEIANLDGRLHEIDSELAEETSRQSRLEALESETGRLSQLRKSQEAVVEQVRRITATLAEQRKLVESLHRQAEAARSQQQTLQQRLAARQAEQEEQCTILAQADEIEASHAAWQQARVDAARWEEIADRFREQEKRREAPRNKILAEQARLEQEAARLVADCEKYTLEVEQAARLRQQVAALQAQILTSIKIIEERETLEVQIQEARQRQTEGRLENPRLRQEMEELRERIDRLEATEGAVCPLCGQPLSPPDRTNLIEQLTLQGKEMGDRYRANQSALQNFDGELKILEDRMAALKYADEERHRQEISLEKTTTQLTALETSQADWLAHAAPRLDEVQSALQNESFAGVARQQLAEIDQELKGIGYDAAMHDATRKLELAGRSSEADLRRLEAARAAMQPVEREILELVKELAEQESRTTESMTEYQRAAAALQAAEAQAPDLVEAERLLHSLQEQENHSRLDLGAARQKVLVLGDLRNRRKGLEAQREAQARSVGQYKQLERAFGKDGVPSLLIEQALPQIESKANEILDRLSGGSMTVRFVTQAAFKDKRREDLKETLDIQISDSAGMRDYELFSGGEAFRVNFAIRLALSEVLAQRAGARLQTLVIDEGFGSQDAEGRQRLIEAINLVRTDFAKILVITHVEELKDAFPNRIEVEKTAHGSRVRIY